MVLIWKNREIILVNTVYILNLVFLTILVVSTSHCTVVFSNFILLLSARCKERFLQIKCVSPVDE